MSVRVMAAVFKRYRTGGSEKLLALALADVARDDGVLMFNDSLAILAEKTSQSERNVSRLLTRMVDSGWLQMDGSRDGGRSRPPVYRISREWLEGGQAPAEAVPPATRAQRENLDKCDTGAPPEAAETTTTSTGNLDNLSRADKEPNTTIEYIPPSPPRGAQGRAHALGKPGRRRGESNLIGFESFLAACRATKQKPIPQGDPVFAYCDTVGISADLLTLHWWEFKRARAASTKRQAGIEGWRQAFRTSVRSNWYQLWYLKPDGEAVLTTRGEQARREQQAEAAAGQAAGHA